ncbi:MAG: hypothetical protein Q9M31_00325, partial [Mariprofundus sp.]|nr:hypothetical protein [Mariprofundus sp.]
MITKIYVMIEVRGTNRLFARHSREDGNPLVLETSRAFQIWIPDSTLGNDGRGVFLLLCLVIPVKTGIH